MGDGLVAPPRVELRSRALDAARSGSLALDMALVAGVALVLGLIRLGSPSFWVDETFTARAVHYSPTEYVNEYHGVYYMLLKPWVAVAGSSEWALRFPSVVGTMLACGLLVLLGRRLLDRRAALAAGLLLAVSPFMIQWSQQARGYTFAVAAAVLATLLLLRAFERGSRWSWALYGLAFTVVVLWHPVCGVLLAPAHGVLILQRRDRFLPHGLLAAVVVGALAVPWAAVVAMRSTGEGAAMNWLKFPSAETAAWGLIDVSGAFGIGLLLALVGLVLLLRSGRSELAVWAGMWALAPFPLALLISIGRPIYLDRYLIVAAPAFALLAGVALVSLAPRPRAVGVVAVAAASCVGLALWYSSAVDGGWRGEDWRNAVAMVLERRGEVDAVVAVPWAMHPAATYYGVDPDGITESDEIWVLVWSEEGHELPVDVRGPLGFGEHRLVERQQFGWRVSAQLWRR